MTRDHQRPAANPQGRDLPDNPGHPAAFEDVLERAADLQRLVPGAVLVGGSAAAHHANHRVSFDDDHVLVDLHARFDTVLENLEALGDWSTAKVRAGKIILGELGGIETGVRQMNRHKPLETETVTVRGKRLVIPTASETLRIKAWLAVIRNQTRDYLDIAALADSMGVEQAARILRHIDDYYAEVNRKPEAVATQLARQLAEPRPRDHLVTKQLASYKGLDPRWHRWDDVRAVLTQLVAAMVTDDE